MNHQQLFAVLREKIGAMLLTGLFFAALAFFSLTVFAKHFQSHMDFLVVQGNAANQDFYTQFKSSEYLGKVLSEAIYSERFIDAVVQTEKVSAEFLPFNKKDKLAKWSDMITVNKNLELGIISVSVKNNSDQDATRVMNGIAQVLTQENMLFRGGDEKSVDIRVLSGPILEKNPSIKKIIEVVLGAFIAGALLIIFIAMVKNEGQKKEENQTEGIEFHTNI